LSDKIKNGPEVSNILMPESQATVMIFIADLTLMVTHITELHSWSVFHDSRFNDDNIELSNFI